MGEKLLDKTNILNIPVLLDEAYIEYSKQDSCVDLLNKYENLIQHFHNLSQDELKIKFKEIVPEYNTKIYFKG